MNSPTPPIHTGGEEGSALVSSLLILMVLTVLATGAYWMSAAEMGAAQGYAQSVRALYSAESGLAMYFASSPSPELEGMSFELYPDPCADTIEYPNPAAVMACYEEEDIEEEELLEGLEYSPPPPRAYAMTGAETFVTSDFVLTNEELSIYRIRSEARVENPSDPNSLTIRVVDRYAALAPPFEVTSIFAATGGVNFDDSEDPHYHFDSDAKEGKDGSCGSEFLMPHIQLPAGQMSIDTHGGDCPDGKGCPYKWHMKGDGEEIDSTYTEGSDLKAAMGLNWSNFLSDAFFSEVSGVLNFDDSDDFMDYYDDNDTKDDFPIARFSGDLTVDEDVEGYGMLIVDGNLRIEDDDFEWTGIIMVGRSFITIDDADVKVQGAAMAGMSCTDAEVASGSCRSTLGGDKVEMKYRPCEVRQSWNGLMEFTPMDDLFREASPGS